jgi:Family of unknown function (DUF5681)
VQANELERRKGGWRPGESGNPAGRPIGTRNKFSEQFLSDVAATWAKHGGTILEKMAVEESARFAELCGRLIPRDVQLTIGQRLPGGLEPDEWQALLAVLQAVKIALPDDKRQPGEIAVFVTEAIRMHGAKLISEL